MSELPGCLWIPPIFWVSHAKQLSHHHPHNIFSQAKDDVRIESELHLLALCILRHVQRPAAEASISVGADFCRDCAQTPKVTVSAAVHFRRGKAKAKAKGEASQARHSSVRQGVLNQRVLTARWSRWVAARGD